MPLRTSFALASLIVVGFFAGSSAETIRDERYGEAANLASRAIAAYMQASNVPGMSVAVVKDGKVIWAEGFGLADKDAEIPVTTETRFRLGSVSKVVTAAALMRLVEKGVVDLDAPIHTYLPDYPEGGGRKKITLRLLAGHLAGIRHYNNTDFAAKIDSQEFATSADALTIFQQDPLENAPGSEYSYSTFGYTLVSAALEAAADTTFEEILKTEVWDALNMTSAGLDRPGGNHRITRFYARNPSGRVFNAPKVRSSYKWAGGGQLANAADLARFTDAHLRRGYLREGTLAEMFTPQQTTGGQTAIVGIGWRVGEDFRDRSIVHHAGSMFGCRAVVMGWPGEGFAISLLSNATASPLYVERTVQTLVELFLNSDGVAAAPSEFVKQYDWSTAAGDVSLDVGWNFDQHVPALTIGDEDPLLAPVAMTSGDKHYLILVHADFGLLPLVFAGDGEGFSGEIRLAETTVRLIGVRR